MHPETSATAREELQHLLAAGVFYAPIEHRRVTAMDYGPGVRDWGDRLGDLDRDIQRGVFRLLSRVLSSDAFIEVSTSIALEYVVDAQSGWIRDRSPGDYWFEVRTASDETPHGFALEGHHLSLDAHLLGDQWEVHHAFFGAAPARMLTADGWMHDLLAGLRVAAESIVGGSPHRPATEGAVPGIESGRFCAATFGRMDPVEFATVEGFVDSFHRRFAPATRLPEAPSVAEPLARVVAPSGIHGDHYVAVRHGGHVYEYLNRADAGSEPNHVHSSVRRIDG